MNPKIFIYIINCRNCRTITNSGSGATAKYLTRATGCKNNNISLESLDFPIGLESIGEQAFFRCDTLKNVYIPDSVTTMGRTAFAGSLSLESIRFP